MGKAPEAEQQPQSYSLSVSPAEGEHSGPPQRANGAIGQARSVCLAGRASGGRPAGQGVVGGGKDRVQGGQRLPGALMGIFL